MTISVKCGTNKELANVLYNRGVELGYLSSPNRDTIIRYVTEGNDMSEGRGGWLVFHTDAPIHWNEKPYAREVLLEDFLFTDKYRNKPLFYEVELNDEYAAKVYKDKIVVGCQKFPTSVLKNLIEAVEKHEDN